MSFKISSVGSLILNMPVPRDDRQTWCLGARRVQSSERVNVVLRGARLVPVRVVVNGKIGPSSDWFPVLSQDRSPSCSCPCHDAI